MPTKSEGGHFTFVLVHGAWCSGEAYKPVSDLLSLRGHRVYVPDLTGCGARSHSLHEGIGLRTHIEDVVNAIRWTDLSKVVLVGHSYAGMVITGVAQEVPELIDSIVYLDAFLPADGQALVDLTVIPEARQLMQDAKARGDSSVPFPPEFAGAFQIPEEILWKFTPHPTATFFDSVPATNGLSGIRKRTFVWATQWPDQAGTFERLQDDSAWNVVSVRAGHLLLWEVPGSCVEILEQAAA
jgi:pimeloyl-ACP methyl ester carboxylesterase